MVKLSLTGALALLALTLSLSGPGWPLRLAMAGWPLLGLADSAPTTLAAPDPSDTYPVITGSTTFQEHINAGLNLMRQTAPDDYAVVVSYVDEIREGSQNWAQGGSRTIQITAASAAFSVSYAGAIVLHEATHVKNWMLGDYPVFGCAGEAKSLQAQANYLERVGDLEMANWTRALIGKWC